jgi:Raf kinase inhibitor-like YbhB/YbcL family protein
MFCGMDLQHTMRSLIRGVPRIALGGVPVERAGEERLAWRRLQLQPSRIQLFSDFTQGEPIPFAHSADGGGFAPPLSWTGLPKEARSLVLLVEDPDAPTPNPFVHWIVYGIPPSADSAGAALARGAHAGRNSMMRAHWTGCAPPKGDHPHRYVFQLFAVDRPLQLRRHAGRSAVVEALRHRVIGLGLLTGTYRR